MEQENKSGRSPDFSGDGVAVWVNQDKNGKPYVSVRLVGHNVINAFKNEPKSEDKGVKTPISSLPTLEATYHTKISSTPKISDTIVPTSDKERAYKNYLHKKASLDEKLNLGMITTADHENQHLEALNLYMSVP